MDVTIILKDGSKQEFRHRPRPGGSYNLHVRYEGAFVIVVDEYHNETAFPAADVKQVQTTSTENYR